MIRKLKVKFILLAMTTLVILLAMIVTGMSLINYASVVKEADMILTVLTQNKGDFPSPEERPDVPLPPEMSPETPHESRFFWVLISMIDGTEEIDISRISSISEEDAHTLAERVLSRSKKQGFVGDFRFAVKSEDSGIRITFLDCGRRLDAFRGFLYTSLYMSLAGLVIVFVVIFVLSGRIIKPIAESYEKQKRFITDAGHEIKTPLTIIAANADILEMEMGEGNDSIADIRGQVVHLRELTDELVMLTRMEEAETSLVKIDFPASEVALDASHPFVSAAAAVGKRLSVNVAPLLTLHGDEKAIRQLVSLLLDNAIKYASAESEISFVLTEQNRTLVLKVTNQIDESLSQEQLSRLFDRFYRADASRNTETGGHGIGLSVAHAIVTAHGGRIAASCPEKNMFRVTVSFPCK